MYKTWRIGNTILGITCLKQIAFSGGIRWYFKGGAPLYSLYVWLDMGPLHIWLAGDWDTKGRHKL